MPVCGPDIEPETASNPALQLIAGRLSPDQSRADLLAIHRALRDSRQHKRGLSLNLYIPFCANLCYYCERCRVITKDRSQGDRYLELLEQEIRILSRHLDPGQRVEQIYLGGGTPTFLSHAALRRLMDTLQKHFNLLPGEIGDYCVEIDPREADWATLGLLREIGFNRISIGLQALDPAVQQALNRLQSHEQLQNTVDAARALRFHAINIDIMIGLPKQRPEGFATTVETLLQWLPERLSVSFYQHRPEQFSNQRRINPEDLPSAECCQRMFGDLQCALTRAGYHQIGEQAFARPDDPLAMAEEDGVLTRNIRGLTTHGHCDLLGLGVCASSQIGPTAWRNHQQLFSYQQTVGHGELPAHNMLRGAGL